MRIKAAGQSLLRQMCRFFPREHSALPAATKGQDDMPTGVPLAGYWEDWEPLPGRSRLPQSRAQAALHGSGHDQDQACWWTLFTMWGLRGT